jgi:hypothetical protein
VCTLEDALLAAERAMVEMANSSGSASATDPDAAVVFEVFALEPIESSRSDDGSGPA